jgi:hypothetical protein
VNSTGVTGLTAALASDNIGNGNGILRVSIAGTPLSHGLANFSFNIGGQLCSFSRIVLANGNGLTDIDGNAYATIIIGNQEWTSENLKVTKYRNGDEITSGLSNSQWATWPLGAFTSIPNSYFLSTQTYGNLYNWFAVSDNRGLCPFGWHIPSNDEWITLTNFLG